MAGEGLFPPVGFPVLSRLLRAGTATPPPPPPGQEDRLRDADGRRAERARALAALVGSEHWWAVREVLAEDFQAVLENVTEGSAHPDCLKVHTRLVNLLDATLQLGRLAMERIVERQLTGVSAVQQLQRPASGRLQTTGAHARRTA